MNNFHYFIDIIKRLLYISIKGGICYEHRTKNKNDMRKNGDQSGGISETARHHAVKSKPKDKTKHIDNGGYVKDRRCI